MIPLVRAIDALTSTARSSASDSGVSCSTMACAASDKLRIDSVAFYGALEARNSFMRFGVLSALLFALLGHPRAGLVLGFTHALETLFPFIRP